MQKIRKRFLLMLILLLFVTLASNILYSKVFNYPLPPSNISPVQNFIILDLTSVISGLRRLGADIAWVQLLQYYATPEIPLSREEEYELSIGMTKYLFGKKPADTHKEGHEESHHHEDYEGGHYYDLYNYCERVISLDPFFFYAYLYGGGALAWNMNRPDEAMKLLNEGINNMEIFRKDITKDVQQPYWQFNLYASAIIYRKKGDFSKMVSLLDTAAKQPESPNLVKVILANIYQKNNKYNSALDLWEIVYKSKDPEYLVKAKEKIVELRKLLVEK